MPGADGLFFASVSHDKRFTLVVAGTRPIGLDIEAISPKIVKAGNYFMDMDELATARSSSVVMTQAVAMVWTAKEAAAKALNLHLIAAWRAVRLLKLSANESSYAYGGDTLTALHLYEWDRVVSLIYAPRSN